MTSARELGHASVSESSRQPTQVYVNILSCPDELLPGIAELKEDLAYVGVLGETDILNRQRWNLRFTQFQSHRPGGLRISNSPVFGNGTSLDIEIQYSRMIEAFRALGHVLAASKNASRNAAFDLQDLERSENANFQTAGIMIDCSRNGVLLPDAVKFMLRKMALMGINMLQLYTEDTYEVEGEPFFGYLRGGYSEKELRTFDDYAYAFGIEIIPCIQTLGHLGQMLQWPRYHHLRDTHDVILANATETYALLRKLIEAASRPFRTNRIHIGMDEAHGVGEGRYRHFFGVKEGTQVFVDHLRQVNAICKSLELKPMIWSDMLFCLQAQNNSLQGYYDSVNPATPELVSSIPENIELVYWDYYHTSSTSYLNKIQQHWQLARKAPWVAGGIWTWSRFWTSLPFTFDTTRACMQASKDKSISVKHSMITVWGDEGNECDIYSALPALLYYAEHCYSTEIEIDIPLLKQKFEAICSADFDDWVYASRLDDITAEPAVNDMRTHFTPNVSKWLFWEEPFYSFMSPQYAGLNLEQHYGQLGLYLWKSIAEKSTHLTLNNRIELAAILATCLSLKCHLRERLSLAYQKHDWQGLRALVDNRLVLLREEVDRLWQYHRKMWMNTYKPFGWEALELRYGGLRTRLATMHWRLSEFLQQIEQADAMELRTSAAALTLPELEANLDPVYPGASVNIILDYHRVSKPCL